MTITHARTMLHRIGGFTMLRFHASYHTIYVERIVSGLVTAVSNGLNRATGRNR